MMHGFPSSLRTRLQVTLLVGAISLFSQQCHAQSIDVSLREKVAGLIDQLGHPSYTQRMAAKAELEQIGIVALDQLHAASFHVDPQIAALCRFIVQSNQFEWSWEYDPPRVREILGNYSGAEPNDKLVYIDDLARLEHDDGIPALCRLARYETMGVLAKKAALLVLKSKPIQGHSIESRARRVLSYVDGGESTASRWLLRHFSLSTEFEFEWWKQQIESESETLSRSPQDSSDEVLRELKKWVIEQACSKESTRLAAVELGQSLLVPRESSLGFLANAGVVSTRAQDFAKWALYLRLHELVPLQHESLSYNILSREPIFTYYLAESYLQAGNQELANSISKQALAQQPVDKQGKPLTSPPKQEDPLRAALESSLGYRNLSEKDRRFVMGQQLADRGQFDWAEKELRLASDSDLTLESTLRALRFLADIQHSLDRNEDAKNTLEKYVSRYEKEPLFQRQMMESSQLSQDIRSMYYFYCGEVERTKDNPSASLQHYVTSLQLDPSNVDALIGAYKLKTLSNEEMQKRQALRNDNVTVMRANIRKYEELLKRTSSSEYASFSSELATRFNNFAWLLINTEGDYSEAIYFSRRACSLDHEEAAFLDTLAHCYAAAERWQDAVDQQRKAVQLKPYHPTFQRALNRFEEKLAQASPTPPSSR